MTDQTPPDADPPVDIQMGGHVSDDGEVAVYTAFARIPHPDEPADEIGSITPLADVRLTFREDVEGAWVAALFQVFVDSVDDLIQRIDQAREDGIND